MAKTAVMVRLSESELSALDAMALKGGISRATCATSILRQRLGAGPNENLAARNGRLQDEAMTPLQPTKDVPRETLTTQRKIIRPETDECAHPFRDNQNRCRVCGHQR